MKKLFVFLGILFLLALVVAGYFAFLPATSFTGKNKYLFVKEGSSAEHQVMKQLEDEDIITSPSAFNLLASQIKVWQRLKPGRFEVKKGETMLTIARRLRNNSQSPVRLVINKLRVNEDFARLIAKEFDKDSTTVLSFINNSDSLKEWNVDGNTFMTLVIPDTYEFYWNTSVRKIISRLSEAEKAFWKKNNRLDKAERQGFDKKEIYTIASIVEEETNKNDEKGNVASVYINRVRKDMPLGADPTIKFALKDFSLRRIYHLHLDVQSPYNTYRNKGLPPGPICTPSKTTLDAVLNAPATDYLFFVAKADFSGYHQFSNNYTQHQQYAKTYQKALDEYMKNKAQ